MKPVVLVMILVIALVLLTSCAPGPNDYEDTPGVKDGRPAGFWLGLWHGVIAPITFIVSLFNDAVNVYEVHNSGGWYNFGFLFGLTALWGGGGGAAGSRNRNR